MTADSPAVVGVGNALVDRTYTLTNLPEPDGGAFVVDHERRFGGVETNVTALLAGLGHEGGVIARLGADEEGAAVREHLEAIGLDTGRVRERAGDETSYTLILLDGAGERMIIGGGDSTLRLELDEGDRAYLAGAEVAFASAYAPAGVLEALAELEGPTTVYDLAGRFEDLEGRGLRREQLDDALPGIDLLVTNAGAARSYLEVERDLPALVDGLQDRGAGRGVVTAGTDGALLFDGDERARVPAFAVETVDTTGAGDAFTAGLVHAWLLGGEPMAEAGRFAAAAAAINCTREGAHASPPTAADVRAFLNDR